MVIMHQQIQAQIEFPENIEHADADLALVDYHQLRGTHWYAVDVASRDAIPIDKRSLGMLVTVGNGPSNITYRYDGVNVQEANWVNIVNWTNLGAGAWDRDSNFVYLNDSNYIQDAPADGNQYARQDGEWAQVTTGGQEYPVSDVTWSVSDNVDATKIMQFDASNITTGTTRTLTIPDQNDTLVVRSDLDAYSTQSALKDTASAIRADFPTVSDSATYSDTSGVTRSVIKNAITTNTSFQIGIGLDFENVNLAIDSLLILDVNGDVTLNITENDTLTLEYLNRIKLITGTGTIIFSAIDSVQTLQAVTLNSALVDDPFTYNVSETWTPNEYKYDFYNQGAAWIPITGNGVSTLSICDENRTSGNIVRMGKSIHLDLGGNSFNSVNSNVSIEFEYLNITSSNDGNEGLTFSSGETFVFRRCYVDFNGFITAENRVDWFNSVVVAESFNYYEPGTSTVFFSFFDIDEGIQVDFGGIFKASDNVIESGATKEAIILNNGSLQTATSARKLKVQNSQGLLDINAGANYVNIGSGLILSNTDYVFEINTIQDANVKIPEGIFIGEANIATKKNDAGVTYNASIDNNFFVYAEDFEPIVNEITNLTVEDTLFFGDDTYQVSAGITKSDVIDTVSTHTFASLNTDSLVNNNSSGMFFGTPDDEFTFGDGVSNVDFIIPNNTLRFSLGGDIRFSLSSFYIRGLESDGISSVWQLNNSNTGNISAPTINPNANNTDVGFNAATDDDSLYVIAGGTTYIFSPDSAWNSNTGVRLDAIGGGGGGGITLNDVQQNNFDSLRASYGKFDSIQVSDAVELITDTTNNTFNDTIDFSLFTTNYPPYQITSDDTIRIKDDGGLGGYGAEITFYGDGISNPVFSEFTPAPGTLNYDSTLDVANVTTFYKVIGTPSRYYYNIWDQYDADFTAPVLLTNTVENSTPTQIFLTYNETLDNTSIPDSSDFSISPDTVVSVAIANDRVTLTSTKTYTSSDTIVINYTPGTNPIRDESANNALALVNDTSTNNVDGFDPLSLNIDYYDATNRVGDGATFYDTQSEFDSVFQGDINSWDIYFAVTFADGQPAALECPFGVFNSSTSNGRVVFYLNTSGNVQIQIRDASLNVNTSSPVYSNGATSKLVWNIRNNAGTLELWTYDGATATQRTLSNTNISAFTGVTNTINGYILARNNNGTADTYMDGTIYNFFARSEYNSGLVTGQNRTDLFDYLYNE
jgi:hypothetical protein